MRRLRNVVRAWRHAPVLWLFAAAPAGALQILEAADHAELNAEVSAQAVNRIALEGDRVARVVQSSGAFTVEHDAVRGDLYLYPADAARQLAAGLGAAGSDAPRNAPAPVTLYLGTEQGFTYRLSLTPAVRDSAQILIRNRALARAEPDPGAAAGAGSPARQGYEQALAALVRAVATRRALPGYVVVPAPDIAESAWNREDPARNVSLVEVWSGPRFSARVLAVRAGAAADAAELAEAYGAAVAAAWLGPAGGGPAGGSLAAGSPADGSGEGESSDVGMRLAVIVLDNGAAETGP